MKRSDLAIKRLFDLVFSFLGLLTLWPIISALWIVAAIDTRANGFFFQQRVGQHGKLFSVIKIRTMRVSEGTTVTVRDDPRITFSGKFLRRYKLDELPQLWNVFVGEMSFVGPRPDVPGFLDCLLGDERRLLQIKPGVTGPATLVFKNEEDLLAAAENPEEYNAAVLWPQKVLINLNYLDNWSIKLDVQIIIQTVLK